MTAPTQFPHSIEAEQFVTGCAILSPTDCLERVNTDWFYDMRHVEIVTMARGMSEDGKPVDVVSMDQRIRDLNRWDEIGLYTIHCVDKVHSVGAFDYYAAILRDKFALRAISRIGSEAAQRALAPDANREEILEAFESEVMAIRKDEMRSEPDMLALVKQAIDRLSDASQNRGQIMGLLTGFYDLDRNNKGMHPGQLIIIAGRPGTGKTAIALNIAENVSIRNQFPATLFSLEMTGAELATRLICGIGGVNSDAAEVGDLVEGDLPKLKLASQKVSRSKLRIMDASEMTMPEIRAVARRHKQKYSTALFIIDYLQLIHTRGRSENRTIEIGRISASMKAMAKELGAPVIALAAVSREVEKEERKPRLSDLRECGSIEADADKVWFLHCAKPDPERQTTDLIIAKHRGGRTGIIQLFFDKTLTRFSSMAPSSE